MLPGYPLPSIPRLETPNLVLREILPEDADAYFELCSDATVMRTFGILAHKTIEDTRATIAFLKQGFDSHQSIRWGITERGSDRLIGDVGFWRIVKERRRAEIGSKLGQAYWSKGYATQALTCVIAFAFESMGLHSVEGVIDLRNKPVVRMCEKVGFQHEGLIREHSYCPYENRFIDTALLSIVKTTWRPRT